MPATQRHAYYKRYPLRNSSQLMEAEFDKDLFTLGQFLPFDEAYQKFPTGQC